MTTAKKIPSRIKGVLDRSTDGVLDEYQSYQYRTWGLGENPESGRLRSLHEYNIQEVTMAHDVDGLGWCRTVAALFRLKLPLFEEFGTLAQWSIGLIRTQRQGQSFWWRSADVSLYNVLQDFMFIDVFLYEVRGLQ
jgi:hypothetical protein